jgi:DNA-binding GntR family transcriptional regulator
MKRFSDGIPNKVLKEIFPKKPNRSPVSEQIYLHLKRMILSGKLKKGQRLLRLRFVHIFDVSERTVSEAFSQLRKERLVIIKPGKRVVVAS